METSHMQITLRPMRKPKRFRSAFSTEQISYLEQQFKKFPYISCEHRKEMAIALNMQERAIKIWFQNRRMKEKKEVTYKDLDYETLNTGDGQDRVTNECVLPSANEKVAYSLPIIVKPTIDTHTNLNKANTDNHKGFGDQVKTIPQHVPQNLSMKHTKAPSVLNNKPKVPTPFINVDLTPKYDTQRRQIKNKNPSNHVKSAYFPVSKKLKKEINHLYANQESKMQRKLEPGHPTLTAKIRTAPEDLSSKKSKTQQAVPKPLKQAKLNGSPYYPVMPTVYAHPYISSGGMIWKPVNIMPVISTGTNISSNVQQNFGPDQKKHCSCNCHENAHAFTVPPNPINPYAQYVITAPYQNPSPKF